MAQFINPFPQHLDSSGNPNASYSVFFGEPNQDPKIFPKAPFSDRSLTVPIATTQILNDTGAYQSDIFLDGSYSIRIETAQGSLWRETPSFAGLFTSFLLDGFLVASMVADSTLAVGDFVSTVGYFSAGDGGDNTYQIVPEDTGTADGGKFIDLTGSGFQAEGLFLGNVIKAKQFGTAGDGITSDRLALFNALAYAALSTTTSKLLITDGNLLIDSNLTVPQGVNVNIINDAQLDIATGITLTWLGNLDAGLYNIFNISGTGLVDFTNNNGQIENLYPEWWGAIADNSTESGPALLLALTAAYDGKITCRWQNGGYALSTPLIIDSRITLIGQNKEDTFLRWTGGASIVLRLTEDFVGGDDPEECLFQNFSIRNTGSATVGFQVEASYATLKEVRIYVGTGDTGYSVAALMTLKSGLPQSNTNQLSLLNCEIRGDNPLASGGNGPIGAWLVGGSNITIIGGYYGVFDEAALKLGFIDAPNAKVHAISNCWLGGGIVMEQSPAFSSGTATCLIVEAAETLTIEAVRFEFGAGTGPNQRGIKSLGQWRGGSIRNCAFAGTGVANSAIDFVGFSAPSIEDADGIVIEGNLWQSVGGAGLNPITLVSGALPNLEIGMNNHQGTGNENDVDLDIADGATIPNVGAGNFFITQNTAPTTISDLDGVQREQIKTIRIIFNDTDTTINFTSAQMRGNAGVDWIPKVGDHMTCTHHQTVWYCDVSRNVV